jgi:DNA-binding transcriptional LysR family regulator
MIDLDQVRTFLAVIETGSFRDGAARLGIAQPTASQHIKKLEAALGYPLIERHRSRAETTARGARFLPFARGLLRLAERAQSAVRSGGLAIGASSNIGIYLLQPLLGAFRAAEPALGPLDIRIGSNPETAQRLEEGEIDIGLMEWWDGRPGFAAEIWRREPLVVIVPPEHGWARRKSIDRAALLQEPMIGGEPGTGTARLLQQTFGVEAQALKVGLQLGSTEAVKQAVRAGLGISIAFESAVRDEVKAGVLHALRLREASLAKPLFSILPAGLGSDNPARRFDAFLRRGAPAPG